MRLPAQSDSPYAAELAIEVDQLVGCFFWWDGADRAKRRMYHGQVAAKLEGGYYLLKFDGAEELPRGLFEVVHLERIAGEAWSIFEGREHLQEALGHTVDTSEYE